MPFHEGVIAAITTIARGASFVTKGAETTIRGLVRKVTLIKIVWPTMRTIGFLGEQLEPAILGLLPEPARELARRLAAASRITGGFPSFIPFMGSFRRGVAYRSIQDMAEGWLTFFPELLVGGTSANNLSEQFARHAFGGNWVEVVDILIDSFIEAGLEDPVTFLRGVVQIGTDMETLIGRPGALTTLTAYLGALLDDIDSGKTVDFQDVIDGLQDLQREEDEPEPEIPPDLPQPDIPLPEPEEVPTPAADPKFLIEGPPIDKIVKDIVIAVEKITGGVQTFRKGLGFAQELIPLINRGVDLFEKALRLVTKTFG